MAEIIGLNDQKEYRVLKTRVDTAHKLLLTAVEVCPRLLSGDLNTDLVAPFNEYLQARAALEMFNLGSNK